mmetsp:Transcript_55551/g.130104  ORF Transcript_55551/g.130104 Transcript_55551/m.130104 type:complete len:328 (-) Transcript_55551:83-1066(-)
MERQVAAGRRQAEEPRARYGAVETRCEGEIVEQNVGGCSQSVGHRDLEAGASGSPGSNESVESYKKSSRIMRNILFCAMFAVTAPFLLLGQELDQTAKDLPTMIPAQRWSFTSGWGNIAYNHNSQSQSQFQAVEHASKLGSRAMHVSSTTIHAADKGSSQLADNRTISEEGVEIAHPGHHSLLAFGPFMFSVGLLLSIIIKLLCAQPCAKTSTDLLHAFMRDQLEKEEAFSSERDPALPSDNSSARETPRQGSARDRDSASRQSSQPRSSGRGSDRWPCKLDLPDAPTPTPIKEAERASSANPWDTLELEGEGPGGSAEGMAGRQKR